MAFPSRKEIREVLKKLRNVEGSYMLPENASDIDQLKFNICAQFIIYRQRHQLSQREMAKLINIDEAVMSKILHYHIWRFTIDMLLTHLYKIKPRSKVTLKVA